jgi:hypothetical protein
MTGTAAAENGGIDAFPEPDGRAFVFNVLNAYS